jgi:hypothetical protein
MACLAGVRQSFAHGVTLLAELAGWHVSDETLRQCCHQEATQVAAWRQGSSAAAERFAPAQGNWELEIDAGKVNTDDGWRDVKLAVFARRVAGPPATSQEWASRKLPSPEVRYLVCGLEEASAFGPRLREVATKLGLADSTQLTLLADGADWIWQLGQNQFPGSGGVLDVFHALEHLAQAGKQLFGEHSEASTAWLEEGRARLLADGWYGVQEQIGHLLRHNNGPVEQAVASSLVGYFSKHTEHLNYAWRLKTGRTIGSGMVEGAIKQVLGRRLKQTGARWRVAHVASFAQLCCLAESDDWSHYWLAA